MEYTAFGIAEQTAVLHNTIYQLEQGHCHQMIELRKLDAQLARQDISVEGRTNLTNTRELCMRTLRDLESQIDGLVAMLHEIDPVTADALLAGKPMKYADRKAKEQQS